MQLVSHLPADNRLVLTYLVRFLQRFAAPESATVTKMDATNLATVWAPNLLRDDVGMDGIAAGVLLDNARREMLFLSHLIAHLDTTPLASYI